MIFAEWIGESYTIKTPEFLRRVSNVIVTTEPGDIIEVHARSTDKNRFVCRGNGSDNYFWGKVTDLKFCDPVTKALQSI